MRVSIDYCDEESGLPKAYDALKESSEPMVMLKLCAHGSHPDVLAAFDPDHLRKRSVGSELDEAVLIPLSAIEQIGKPISVRLIDAVEGCYNRYVKHELSGVREHLLRLEGMIYQMEAKLSGRGGEKDSDCA